MGICPVHCPPASSALRGPLLALGALAAVVTGVWVLALAVPFLAAAAAACAVLAYPAVRVARWSARLSLMSPNTVAIVVRRGGLPAPARQEVKIYHRPALPPPPLAIESGLLAGQDDPAMRETLRGVSAGLRDRYGSAAPAAPAVVPGAVEESRMKA